MDEVEARLDKIGWLPWGRRLRAYREHADLTLKQAAEEIDPFVRTSSQSMFRLEKCVGVPAGRQQRAAAAMACVIYGIHPEVLDLSMEDLPAVDEERLLGVLDRRGVT